VVKADAAIVVVRTDDGTVGIGEATPYGAPLLIAREIDRLAPTIIGAIPSVVALPPPPERQPRAEDFPHIPPIEAALAGLDTALWDLRAQAEGRSVARMIGPDPLPRLRVYASSGCTYDWRVDPHALVDDVVSQQKAGFTACKIRIGTDWRWDGVTVDRFLGLLREVRAACGSGMELMLDGNMRLDFDTALTVGRELERLGFVWFEEPTPLDVATYARLAAQLDIPVTGCEGLATFAQTRPFLDNHSVDIVQPDVAVAGFTEARKIAEHAASRGIEVCTHNWHNDLMTVANAHFMAGIGSQRPLERCRIQGPLQSALLREPLRIVGGQLDLPTGPGLGVALADGLAARFPYVEGHYALTVPR
jgi:L-alanine-DL-glutamate epimerase-like enolase superfamily enzyme